MYTASVTCVDFQEVTWQVWPSGSVTNELAVFRIALSDSATLIPYLRKLLSPDEIERAARYRRPDDRFRFSGTRGLLRVLLGRYIRQPPDHLDFVVGVSGKPTLKENVGWHFNVSHSGDWLLIAIGRTPVGVDLERVSPDFPFRDVLSASFSPDEQRHIDGCPDARLGFYQLWTRKEALVKATANGLGDALDRIPSLTGAHLADARLPGQKGNWMVGSFTVAEGYPAAVAHNGISLVLPHFYTLDSSLVELTPTLLPGRHSSVSGMV